MTFAVVTTFSQKGYQVYGRKMIETFAKFWPPDVPLHVFYEGEKPQDASPRATWHSLDADPDRAAFVTRHKDTELHDYRKCAVRYSHKVWAMTAAPRDAGNLIWLDADCETFAPVSSEMIKAVCSDPGQVGSFLARPYHRHTETGFWSVRMNNCGGDFLDELRRMYVLGEIYNLNEWHDCMAFDFVRRRFERSGHRFKNLCPNANGLAVFEQSRLKDFIRHHKGPERKGIAYGDSMLPEGLGSEATEEAA